MSRPALSPAKRELLARRLRGEPGDPGAPIPRRAASGPAPLSPTQERIWFVELLLPGRPLHNISSAVRLRGPLRPAALAEALAAVVRRHEALRTGVRSIGGEPRQVVTGAVPLEVPLEPVAGEEELAARIAGEAGRPFDLASPPLLRARLWRLGDGDHVLALVVHHLVADGWSLGVLFGDLRTAYERLLAGGGPDLAPPALQYADYAEWQRGRVEAGELDVSLGWWREALRGAPEVLDLPRDGDRR
ncbi:MAG TPA: condensation domain-containing protein, partial [Candidatus Eisenbacteria bacterium]|nr:condensation domain-containing protein [Candidatus Eisenbacteria bacterium]